MSNSEKIEQIRFRADVADAEGMIEMEQFLAEYADLLEAIDKAEPVAELVNEYSEGHGYLCRHIKLLDLSLQDGTKFYAHPLKQEQSPIDERAEFEKWFNTQDYSADVRTWAWNGFRAARKLSAPEVVSKTTDTIVPDAKDELDHDGIWTNSDVAEQRYIQGWNDCRAAMQANCDAILKGEK